MNLNDYIKTNEGYSSHPYRCSVGKTTIGWGRNLDANGITKQEAELMFQTDLAAAELCCNRQVGRAFASMCPARQAALIDMAFNMGERVFSTFKKMLAAIQIGDWDTAATEVLDSNYAKQVHGRARMNAVLLATGSWHDAHQARLAMEDDE